MLHFSGITQLASAIVKDKSQFTSMLNMTEEESKKEKDSDEDDLFKDIHYVFHAVSTTTGQVKLIGSYAHMVEDVTHQHTGDQFTPPPDFS